MNRSTATIHEWTRRPDWRWGKKDFPLEEIREWRATTFANPGRGPGAGSNNRTGGTAHDKMTERARRLQVDKAEAQTTVAAERAKTLKLERELRQGKLVERDEVERRHGANNSALRTGLQRAARALRMRLADETDPRACEKIMLTAFKAICDHAFGKAEAVE